MIRPTCFVIVLVIPAHVFAQTVPSGWTRIPPIGKRVFVINNASDETAGRLEEVTVDEVVLQTASGRRTIPLTDIRTVQRTDPAWTGLLIGGAAGLALGLSIRVENACPQRTQGCLNEVRGARVGFPLWGALVGWGLDALYKGRKTIYSAGP
jgi:hypothetical protein